MKKTKEENEELKSFVNKYKKELDLLAIDYDFNFKDLSIAKSQGLDYYRDEIIKLPKNEKDLEKLAINAYASMLDQEEHISFDEYQKIFNEYNLDSLSKYFGNEEPISNQKDINLKEARKISQVKELKNNKAKQKL